ncbi:hypothetical protein C8N46_11153 [Kordia periserrulae]|uniref:Uncharacterized protein n=1 Tax=Kordia periserrulae TaxID=701523 RepID=A0A2T6BSE8_9FLAO|nr:hypothetical protein [Kordia periserrulae]PTX58984.1 hypothetical protein C8N46_11153 [Kordia periserrulae]
MDFKELLKELKGNLLSLMGSKFDELKDESKKDVQAFLNASKEKLERWTTLLAEGNITVSDYKWLVESQKDLVVLKGLYAAGVSKIKLGHLKNSILDTVIETAIGFVKPNKDDDNEATV